MIGKEEDPLVCEVCGEIMGKNEVTTECMYSFPCSCCDGFHKIVSIHHAKCFYEAPEVQNIKIKTEYLKEPVRLALELIKTNFGSGRKGSYYDRWGYKLVRKIRLHTDLTEKQAVEIAVDFLDSLFDNEEDDPVYNPRQRGYKSIREISEGK